MSHLARVDVPERLTLQALCYDHVATVCRFAALLGGSAEEAEDIAQQALPKAIRKLDQHDPRRGPRERWFVAHRRQTIVAIMVLEVMPKVGQHHAEVMLQPRNVMLTGAEHAEAAPI